ncbi:MAG: MATE family efflux transporter [Rhodobacteraceae bacterium]|nr:MATE family efflux transporter [Paracoccaceae bacterium]
MTTATSTPQTYGPHFRATILLGAPMVGTMLAQMIMGITDTVMLGWLGAAPLAASVLGTQIFLILLLTGSGFAQAVVPLAAHALGAGDTTVLRRAVRMGFWVTTAFTLVVFPLMWFAEPILLALGQAPELARMADQYLSIAKWSFLPNLFIMVLRSYFGVVGKAHIVLVTTLIAAVVNGFLNYALIFGNWGAPAMGIEGAAYATLGSALLSMVLLLVITNWHPALAPHAILKRFWRSDWVAFWEVTKVGWPIGVSILAEFGLFAMSAIMMGWFGTVPLAAHGIVMQLISIAFMVPLGLSQVATIRLGLAKGRKNPEEVTMAGRTVLIVGIGFALAITALLILAASPLLSLFLDFKTEDAAAILAFAIPLLAVAAAFQLVDTLQVLAAGLLRGLKDTRVPMQYALFSYWIIGIPAAYALSQYTSLEAIGIWVGLAIGLTVSSLLGMWRYGARAKLGLI